MEQAYPPPIGLRLAEKVILSMLPVGLIISGGREGDWWWSTRGYYGCICSLYKVMGWLIFSELQG